VENPSFQRLYKALYVFWIILIVPWVPFALLAGMAFDSGPSFSAYLFVSCVWTYPIVVLIAFLLKKRVPMIGFLPFLNLGAFCLGFFL
jgi:hypothetical protein